MAYNPQFDGRRRPMVIDALPDTDGVLARRVLAYLLDAMFIALIAAGLAFFAFMLTIVSLGLLHGVWAIVPFTAILYSTLTIGGPASSTWGMRMMGLAYRRTDGAPPDYAQAFILILGFYLSIALTSGLILLLALITERHRTLHDLLAGLVMVRISGF